MTIAVDLGRKAIKTNKQTEISPTQIVFLGILKPQVNANQFYPIPLLFSKSLKFNKTCQLVAQDSSIKTN